MVRLKSTITPNGLGVAGIWASGHWVTSVTVALDPLWTRHWGQIMLEGRQKLRQAFQNKRNPEEIRTNHLQTKADALRLCAVLRAQPLRHTSLKTRVPFCAMYSCYPLCLSPLSCLTWRPESGFILTPGLPFEGSGWSKISFGVIFQIVFRALRRQAKGPCAAFVCVHLCRGFEGWYYVFLGYWYIWSLLTIESVRPLGAWLFRHYTLRHYVKPLYSVDIFIFINF